MSKVAITGCASRFAQVLLPLLEADPDIDTIIGIDRVPPKEMYYKLTFHKCDIRDAHIGELFSGCQSIIHLAFIVLRPYRLPLQEAADINLRGTWNVCQAAVEAGVEKLIVSSSIAAYGSLPDNPDPLLEESPLRGLYSRFYYSQHKHANELWLDGLQAAFPHVLISRLRPCIVIGPRQSGTAGIVHPNNTHFSGTYETKARMQLIHEDDLASAFYVMQRHDLPGAYNVVADGPDTMRNIASAAGLQIVEVPDELLRQQAYDAWKQGLSDSGPEWIGGGDSSILCSNEKLKATGVWTPCYTTTEALAATIQAMTE